MQSKIKQWKKSFCLIAVLILFGGFILSGCGNDSDSEYENSYSNRYYLKVVSKQSTEYASDQDVDSCVMRYVETENVELKDKTKGQRKTTYLYHSMDRDMTFEVESMLQGYGGIPTGGNTKQRQVVIVNYGAGIQAYYWPQVSEALENATVKYQVKDDSDKIRLYIHSFSDLQAVTDVIMDVDDIYKQETAYNTPQFMKEYTLCKFVLYVESAASEELYVTSIEIDGAWEKEGLYQYLTSEYAKANSNGVIADQTIPEEVAGSFHKDVLYNIFIDDTNVSDEAYYARYDYKNAKRVHGPMSDSFYSCPYYETLDSYIILLDVGPVYSGNEWELIMDEYLKKLADAYTSHRDESTSEITWSLSGDDYKIITKDIGDEKYGDYEFSLYKNGEKQDLEIIKRSDYGAMTLGCVGITVEDFAKLFHLSVEIDEKTEDGCIYFSTNP